MTGHLLRAFWPIVDERAALGELYDEARSDLALLARQAHARVVGPVRFTIADASTVPGSGDTTRLVLLAHAPAIPHRDVE